jgi:surface polysaccharide O-acyltransferase-like enzyme
MLSHQKRGAKLILEKITLPGLLALFVLPLLMQAVLDFGGKSVGEYFAFFLLGYFLLSQERVLGLLDRARAALTLAFAAGFALTFLWGMELYAYSSILSDALSELYGWVGILTLLSVARRYWNKNTKVTAYLVKSSFGVYLFHQSWIIIVAYFVFRLTQSAVLQIPLILLLSVPLTFLTYELAKRFSVTRFLFGLKK